MVLDGVGLIEITIECLKHPIKWDWIRLEWMDWDGWMDGVFGGMEHIRCY